MKNIFLFVIIFCVTISACTKEDTLENINEDSGCIELKIISATDHRGHSINSTNIPIINQLFSINTIDKSRYR